MAGSRDFEHEDILGGAALALGLQFLVEFLGKGLFKDQKTVKEWGERAKTLGQLLPNPFGIGLNDERIIGILLAKASKDTKHRDIASRYGKIRKVLSDSEGAALNLVLSGIRTTPTKTATKKKDDDSLVEVTQTFKEFSEEDNRYEYLLFLDDEFLKACEAGMDENAAAEKVADMLRDTGTVRANKSAEAMQKTWQSLVGFFSKIEDDPKGFLDTLMEHFPEERQPVKMGFIERLVNRFIVFEKEGAETLFPRAAPTEPYERHEPYIPDGGIEDEND